MEPCAILIHEGLVVGDKQKATYIHIKEESRGWRSRWLGMRRQPSNNMYYLFRCTSANLPRLWQTLDNGTRWIDTAGIGLFISTKNVFQTCLHVSNNWFAHKYFIFFDKNFLIRKYFQVFYDRKWWIYKIDNWFKNANMFKSFLVDINNPMPAVWAQEKSRYPDAQIFPTLKAWIIRFQRGPQKCVMHSALSAQQHLNF